MACSISTQEQLTKLDSFEAVGLVIGLVIGGAAYWYWEYGRSTVDPWGLVMNKFFPLVFGVGGLVAGYLARIVWQQFC